MSKMMAREEKNRSVPFNYLVNKKGVVMKKLMFMLLVLFASQAMGQGFTIMGNVKRISVLSSNLAYDDALVIEGLTSANAGGCAVTDGEIVLRIRADAKGDRQISLLLSAKLAGQPVTVNFRDDAAELDPSGSCYLRHVTL